MLKICTKCNKEYEASLDNFYKKNTKDGLSHWCKTCTQKEMTKYRKENRNKINEKAKSYLVDKDKKREYDKMYYQQHKQKIKEYHREQYAKADKDKIREYHRNYNREHEEQRKEYYLKYRENNLEQLKEYDRLRRERNRLNIAMSCVIYYALKENKAEHHWEDLVPYNLQELKEHLESQFTPEMSWDNYGSYWEIDHIIPKNLFNTTVAECRDFQICWSLANLRPLSATENRRRPKDGSDISENLKQKILQR